PATGLGATIALLCDIVFIGEQAKIGDPHVKVGLVAGDGGATIWPWLLGPARAKQYLLTGDLLTGTEAAALGLVNEAVPESELLARARSWAHRVATGSQPAIRGTKAAINKLLRNTATLNFDTALSLERQCFDGQDVPEAIRA